MVLSGKNSLSKKKNFESGFLDLTLELHEILNQDFGSNKSVVYARVCKQIVSLEQVTRITIFRSTSVDAGLAQKFKCVSDSLENKLAGELVAFKKGKSLCDLFTQEPVKASELSSCLNLKLTTTSWSDQIDHENTFLFPSVRGEKLSGFICVELNKSVDKQSKHKELFSFLKLVSQLLHSSLVQVEDNRLVAFKEWLFESFAYPVFLIDVQTKRILKANNVLESSLADSKSGDNCSPASLVNFVESVVEKVNERNPLVWTRGYLPNLYGDFYVIATVFGVENNTDVVALIVPANDKQWDFVNLLGELSKGNLLAEAATKQLYWDRLIRQVVTRLHSTLDANMILQLMVDNVGQCLSASRCIFIKADSDSMTVTHEYTNPSISPLGFGRTARFPEAVVNLFRNGPLALSDVTALRLGNTLASSDVSSMLNNGITSLAGAPVACSGVLYGVLIVIELGENREWTSNEMEMIRLASSHAANAIELSMEHQKIKDQLYQASTVRVGDTASAQGLLSSSSSIKTDSSKVEKVDMPHLSERELEVLRLIASGLSNKEIAGRLFLTASTVELHASRMRKKLKMKSRTQLVKYACDHGLV